MSEPPPGPPEEPGSPDRDQPPDRPSDPLGFSIPVPRRPQAHRSTSITVAAVVLILAGFLEAIGVLVLLSTDRPGGQEGRLIQGAVIAYSALAAMNLLAGFLVLRLRANGRFLGLASAGIGIVIGLAGLASTPGRSLVTLVVDGFVAWVLITEGDAFRRPGEL